MIELVVGVRSIKSQNPFSTTSMEEEPNSVSGISLSINEQRVGSEL